MLAKLLSAFKSPKFFIGIVVLFILQGVFFAIAVNPSDIDTSQNGTVTRIGGVVPDGNRHIGAIYYFAKQPIQNGPFIHDMADSDLWMGDLERFPSFLYYYLMSMIIRIPIALHASDFVNVMIIRFIGLALGVLALFVFRKILFEITSHKTIINLSILALALTGSFVYLAPAENYDVMSLLFFLLFMLASLRLFKRQTPGELYWMLLWFLVGSITKYTYMPFMGLFGIVAIILYVKRHDSLKNAWTETIQKLADSIKSIKKIVFGIMVLLVLVAGALFVERIGVNLVAYHAVEPDCAAIHSQEACMNFGVYERNFNRQQVVASGEEGTYIFNPAFFTVMWLYKYYTSMYAYVGHIWIEFFSAFMYAGMAIVVVSLIVITVYVKRRKVRLLDSLAARYTFFVTATLILLQYAYNAKTFIEMGGVAYATQGRYLLSAIGFVYMFFLVVAVKFLRTVPKKDRQRATWLLVVIAVIAILSNSALPVFFMHANSPEWFSWT